VRLLITGGAGCLGFNLIEEHLAQGNEILVIDNFATGSREALAASPRLEIVDGTVADRELVDVVFARFAPMLRVRSIPSRRRIT
jgi:UDP-glucose 4-epimerase